MKKVLTLLLILITSFVTAQQQTNAAQDLPLPNNDIPNSPAFILMDAAPETIYRPNSSKALGLTLLQDFTSNSSFDNFGVEVTPFWMTPHKNMTALKFYGVDKDLKQNPFSKLKLVTISGAYIKQKDSIVNVSLGARATIFELKRESVAKKFKESYLAIENLLEKENDFEDEYDNNNPEAFKEFDAFDELEEEDTEAYKIKKKESEEYESNRDKYIENRKIEEKISNTYNIREIIEQKPAFVVDLAVAYNQRFLHSQFNENGMGRFGIWSTVAGTFYLDKEPNSKNYLNIYGFFRYLNESNPQDITNNDDTFNALDVGVKAEFEFKKITIGYEYISRSGDMKGYRSAGTIKYNIIDNTYITGTFGNNFDKQDDLISLFGIQWGINSPNQGIDLPEVKKN